MKKVKRFCHGEEYHAAADGYSQLNNYHSWHSRLKPSTHKQQTFSCLYTRRGADKCLISALEIFCFGNALHKFTLYLFIYLSYHYIWCTELTILI